MLGFGAFAFASPWMLLALLSLPALWWLLRITPPAPKNIRFPAIRLLFGLENRQQTPASAPLWLVILRLTAATLVILGLAHPLLNPGAALPGQGPLILVVDDGWAAATRWPARQAAMRQAIDRAARAGRPVVLLATAPPAEGRAPEATDLLSPSDARGYADALQPKPWPTDRAAAAAAAEHIAVSGPSPVVWLSDGIGDDGAALLAERLQRFGSLRLYTEIPENLPRLLLPPEVRGTELKLELRRVPVDAAARVAVRASAADGRPLAREEVQFAPGADTATVTLDVPVEVRNEVTRLEIENESSAGAVVLLDERWRRRPVGLATGAGLDGGLTLLGDYYYVDRALNPFSAVRRGSIDELIAGNQAVIVTSDSRVPDAREADALDEWVRGGGLLLRFAGPQMARSEETDPLLPVTLRRGGRTLGGAMLWSKPAQLAPFDEDSPFRGLAIPKDVTITRQVLAEPSLDLADKTWARLTDGTPLVTAERRGKGWLVLVHTTANTDWTNLPLSGLFVEMLQRVVAMSQGVAQQGAGDRPLPPQELLDGFGRAVAPSATAGPIDAGAFEKARVGPGTPPGFYGTEQSRRALNLSPQIATLRPLAGLPAGIERSGYAEPAEVDLKPWLLAAALVLLLVDTMVTLGMRGLLPAPRPRRGGATPAVLPLAVLLLAGLALGAGDAKAQDTTVQTVGPQGTSMPDGDEFALQATLSTHLAYVVTGNPTIDDVSRAGLTGLSHVLNQRTAAEVSPPIGVDIQKDELSFFPLLYWPVDPGQQPPSPDTAQRLNRFLEAGGTILFDTRDRNLATDRFGPNAEALRNLTRGLNLPPLVPVPPEHILTKAFYLMQEFPGRWAGGRLWVEPPGHQVNDGVSRIIVGGNDWAAAWAVDEAGRPQFPVVPGGEEQREMAYRFGVNLVMYTLTGSYKADQVHVPAILERLGQ